MMHRRLRWKRMQWNSVFLHFTRAARSVYQLGCATRVFFLALLNSLSASSKTSLFRWIVCPTMYSKTMRAFLVSSSSPSSCIRYSWYLSSSISPFSSKQSFSVREHPPPQRSPFSRSIARSREAFRPMVASEMVWRWWNMLRRTLWETHQSGPELMPITAVASTPVSKSNLIQPPLGLDVDYKLIRKRNPVILKSTPTQLGVFGVVSIGFPFFCSWVGVDLGGRSVSFFCKHRPDELWEVWSKCLETDEVDKLWDVLDYE